ncbi:MAG: hypothetical protein NZ521_09665, partial [Flammeovirgaceae bacterium]|nr:hypothetical protein [Flammeovirgaceae bacterium]MDW8287997.1 hypothetical protein [Flammeovirgaceae bacterium]
KLVKELLKIDLVNAPLSLNKERLAHTHLEIRNGCLASIKADLQYYQEEVPQVIGKEVPTCQRGSYRILSADFDNHYLKVQVTYKGSRPHAFALIYPEVITMIHPPRFGIYLQHDDQGDQGTKTVLHTLKIDLSKNPLGFSAKLIAEAELTLINPCPPMQLFKEKPSQSHDPVLPFSPIPQVFGKSVSDYQSSPFHIDGAGFDGYILKIAVRYKGTSPYDFKLVYPENIITIYPPVFSVYLVANDKGSTGTNTITETFLIDLRKNPHDFPEKVILESKITLVNASNVEQTFKNH